VRQQSFVVEKGVLCSPSCMWFNHFQRQKTHIMKSKSFSYGWNSHNTLKIINGCVHIWMNLCTTIHIWLHHSNDCWHSSFLKNLEIEWTKSIGIYEKLNKNNNSYSTPKILMTDLNELNVFSLLQWRGPLELEHQS
jgi:hypothetical protein